MTPEERRAKDTCRSIIRANPSDEPEPDEQMAEDFLSGSWCEECESPTNHTTEQHRAADAQPILKTCSVYGCGWQSFWEPCCVKCAEVLADSINPKGPCRNPKECGATCEWCITYYSAKIPMEAEWRADQRREP